MPHLPRVAVFPITGENSLLTAGGAALRIPAREKAHPFVGQLAPEIQLKDHCGRLVSLHATIALGRPIVPYFFPLAGSPHCTKESCTFRDALGTSPVFNDLNVIVIGISQDSPQRQRRFVDEHQLNFRVLHDENRETLNAWGVGRTLMGLIDARCTFIIDHLGTVRAMAEGVWDYQGHIRFAESWLIRIEHDLAGRDRHYLAQPDDPSGFEPAGLPGETPIRVIYGDRRSASAGGVSVAPRFGAAPLVPQNDDHASSSDDRQLTSPRLTSAALKSSKSKKSLRDWFSTRNSHGSAAYDEPVHVDRTASLSSESNHSGGTPPVPSLRHRPQQYSDLVRNRNKRNTATTAASSSSSEGFRTSTADTSVGGGLHSRNGSESLPASQQPQGSAAALSKHDSERVNVADRLPAPSRTRAKRHSVTSNGTFSDSSWVAGEGSFGEPRYRRPSRGIDGVPSDALDDGVDAHVRPPYGRRSGSGSLSPASRVYALPDGYRPHTAESGHTARVIRSAAWFRDENGLGGGGSSSTSSLNNLNLDGSPRGPLPLPRAPRRNSMRRRAAATAAAVAIDEASDGSSVKNAGDRTGAQGDRGGRRDGEGRSSDSLEARFVPGTDGLMDARISMVPTTTAIPEERASKYGTASEGSSAHTASPASVSASRMAQQTDGGPSFASSRSHTASGSLRRMEADASAAAPSRSVPDPKLGPELELADQGLRGLGISDRDAATLPSHFAASSEATDTGPSRIHSHGPHWNSPSLGRITGSSFQRSRPKRSPVPSYDPPPVPGSSQAEAAPPAPHRTTSRTRLSSPIAPIPSWSHHALPTSPVVDNRLARESASFSPPLSSVGTTSISHSPELDLDSDSFHHHELELDGNYDGDPERWELRSVAESFRTFGSPALDDEVGLAVGRGGGGGLALQWGEEEGRRSDGA